MNVLLGRQRTALLGSLTGLRKPLTYTNYRSIKKRGIFRR